MGKSGDPWAAPAVRPPSGLVADGGDGKVTLEWNPNLEPELAGYAVYRRKGEKGEFLRITTKPVKGVRFVDRGRRNGRPAAYAVTALLKGGAESGRSNVAAAMPHELKAPDVQEGPAAIEMPGYGPAKLPNALTVRFQNGHTLVFDRDLVRARDWQTPEGIHILVPAPYGNAVDITAMDENGFPQAQPATEERPALPPPITLDYARRQRQCCAWWVGHEVGDDGITFHYRLPLSGPGVPQGSDWDLWIWADVHETWRPAVGGLPGTTYSGLRRRIELEMPSSFREGYSVCLNDGFGVNGSCEGALTYELRWGNPILLEQHWQKGQEMRGIGTPRTTEGFHPTMAGLQVSPFLFMSFPQGTLLLAPRHYYHATTYCLANYAAQGKDGLWPNLTTDCAAAGRRFTVEEFEYLWTADTELPPPQKFMDASFHFRRRLADLYSLPRTLSCMDYAWDYWGPGADAVRGKTQAEGLAVLERWGKETAEKAVQAGADRVGGAHELWTSSPYTVPDAIRLDPAHPINRAIARMVRAFRNRGLSFGYWVRPEFVKQALAVVLSERFFTPYYGYVRQLFPPGTPIVETEGLKLIREHTEWLRRNRAGQWPTDAPYHWTPASLTTGWYDEVVYKSLVMMKELGYASILQDGGFSCLAGVDYTPGHAVAIQPYYWRFTQDAARLGLDLNGECMTGWGNNSLTAPAPEDMKNAWAFVHSIHRGNRDGEGLKTFTPEMRHLSHQLYCACYTHLEGGPGHAAAGRFAQQFLREHGHPDRVFLEGLRWSVEQEQWVWDKVWWEYGDGMREIYPDRWLGG